VLLLLVATAAARELSSQSLFCQVTCDYWCSPPLLLLFPPRCSAAAAGRKKHVYAVVRKLREREEVKGKTQVPS
jgi:hypothetical protein